MKRSARERTQIGPSAVIAGHNNNLFRQMLTRGSHSVFHHNSNMEPCLMMFNDSQTYRQSDKCEPLWESDPDGRRIFP